MKVGSVSTDSQGSTSSVEGGSASLHDEIQAFGQSGSTNGDNSSVGKVKERIDHSQTIPKTKRSYQIGRNTGRDLRNLGSKKRNKLEEK
ncbi:hypothetical protein [Priestia aryabhattai]|uniref:hypothetical protein n=1 Tax=Priestia aryabhattai TaxID=412384 RepID=UPI003D2CD5EE